MTVSHGHSVLLCTNIAIRSNPRSSRESRRPGSPRTRPTPIRPRLVQRKLIPTVLFRTLTRITRITRSRTRRQGNNILHTRHTRDASSLFSDRRPAGSSVRPYDVPPPWSHSSSKRCEEIELLGCSRHTPTEKLRRNRQASTPPHFQPPAFHPTPAFMITLAANDSN